LPSPCSFVVIDVASDLPWPRGPSSCIPGEILLLRVLPIYPSEHRNSCMTITVRPSSAASSVRFWWCFSTPRPRFWFTMNIHVECDRQRRPQWSLPHGSAVALPLVMTWAAMGTRVIDACKIHAWTL
jgi:hypothetical protein